jgi:hypothetical protein
MLKAEITNSVTIAGPCYAGKNVPIVAGLSLRTAVVYSLLFVVAFCFYSVVWINAPVMEPDSWTYLGAAQDLSDFHIDQLQERTPGYPLLLLLTGSSQSPSRTLFFVSLLMHFASVWLLASILSRAGIPQMMLYIFGFILLLPPYVEPAGYVLSENLTEAMLVTGFVTFVFWILQNRTTWIFISGLTIGYAALTRPTYQLLAFAMAGYILVANFLFHSILKWKDVIKGSVILVCGSIVITAGYAFVNYRSVGYFGATPQLGFALTQKTLRVVERLPDEYAAIRETLIRARNSALVSGADHTGDSYIDGTVPELIKVTGLDRAHLSNTLLRINLLLILKAPAHYFQEVVWAFGSYWFPSSGELANLNSRAVQLLWAVINFLLIGGFAFNLIILVAAAISICKRFVILGDPRPVGELRSIQLQGLLYGLAGTIVLYSAVLICLVQTGLPRYRVPTDGLIVFMLFLGTHLWRRLVDASHNNFYHAQGHEPQGIADSPKYAKYLNPSLRQQKTG